MGTAMHNLSRIIMVIAALVACLAASADEAPQQWTFDVELRERATYLRNFQFNPDNPNEGWLWAHRLAVGTEGSLGGGWSVHVNVQNASQSGIDRTPIEANELDVRAAWLNWQNDTWSVRIGRETLGIGSARLVATRDGTNVRRGFDGISVGRQFGDWRITARAAALVDVESSGAFNDEPDTGQLLGGLYASGLAPRGKLDLYWFWSRREDRSTLAGIADQERHSIGARAFGDTGSWFWDWETIYQFGEHGDLDIDAWTLAANTGRRFDAAWRPEVMLSVNIASGDDDPNDDELGTFDALYPRGNYFSDLAMLGPSNFFNIHPFLRLQPTDRLKLSIDANWYWRLERTDALYGPPGNVIRAPGNSDARFVNWSLSLGSEYELNRNLSVTARYTRSEARSFIAETGADDAINFLELTLLARF